MAINSNLSIFHPTKLAQYLRQLQFAARPMIRMSATAPIGQNIAGALSTGGKTVDVNAPVKPGQSVVGDYTGTYATPDNPDASQLSLTINKHKVVRYRIDKADQRLSPIAFLNNWFLPYYQELVTAIDADVKAEARLFNAAFAELNSGTTVMDNEDFTEAKRILKERQFVSGNLVSVIDSAAEKDLSDLSLFHQANTGERGGMLQRDGFLDRKFGFDIYVDEAGHSEAHGFDADARTAEAVALGEKAIDVEDAGSAALTTAATEGEVLYFTGASTTDDFYVADGSNTTSLLNVKEDPRKAVTDQTVIVGVDGTSQFFFKQGAVSLVTLGMSSVTPQSNGVSRTVFFDPTNNINTTISWEETTGGADVTIEALYGVKNFYPEWGVRYIRGNNAKA